MPRGESTAVVFPQVLGGIPACGRVVVVMIARGAHNLLPC